MRPKIIAIMQPTYLPWSGYFDLMDRSDHFVFLDNVQFSKQSWQQRNRLKSAQGPLLLTVPVYSKDKSEQKICDVKISQKNFSKDHLKSIDNNYKRSSFFKIYFPEIENLYQKASQIDSLSTLNIMFILWLKNKLSIKTPTSLASTFQQNEGRIDRLLSLCEELKAQIYLSPKGAKNYLCPDLKAFNEKGIKVVFQEYTPVIYDQLYPPFISHLSVLDLLFNHGPKSIEIIRQGRH